MLCCLLVFAISAAPVVVQDDDYCDDTAHGTDERNSSACTFINSLKYTFTCAGDTSINIPLSRVGDGVCDCCDGSDESKGSCQDTCAQQKLNAKVQALQWHRHLQAGILKRTELVNSLMRKKAREALTMDTLNSDRNGLERLDMGMRYWQREEDGKEAVSHWRLLRERELRCIRGDERFCNFFYDGFLAEDELYVPNAPHGFLARSRNRNETKVEDGGSKVLGGDSGAASDILKSQSPMERVKGTLCKVNNIIPDDSLRVFVTVGDYLNFQSSPGGSASRKKNAQQKRKETLFVRFLEASGENGQAHGVLLIGELASLALVPVMLPLYAAAWVADFLRDRFWSHISTCAAGNDGSWSLIRSLCHTIVQTTVPGSVANEVVNVFDYTQYSAVSSFLDHHIHPYRMGPNMVMKLLWYAPIMYWDYYVSGRGSHLPPSRHTCLLRAGSTAVREELASLRRRQQEEKELAMMLEAKERSLDAALSGSGTGLIDGSWADYGELGEYEVLKRECVTSLPLGSPPYSYTLCYFQDVVQTALGVDGDGVLDGSRGESVTLGKFVHWGPRPGDASGNVGGGGDAANKGDPTLQFRDKNQQAAEAVRADREAQERSKESKSNLFSDWTNKISTVLGNLASGTTGAARRAAALEAVRGTPGYFEHQTYAHGDTCYVAGGEKPRAAQVSFHCSATAAIEAVEEPETCVYNLRVTGPMACTAAAEAASLDTLDKLGVFGYTKKTSKAASLEDTADAKKKKADRAKLQTDIAKRAADTKVINEAKTEAAKVAQKAARKLAEDTARDRALGREKKPLKMADGGELKAPGGAQKSAPAAAAAGKGKRDSGKLHMDVIEAAVDGSGELQQLSEDTEFLSLMDTSEEEDGEEEMPTLLDPAPAAQGPAPPSLQQIREKVQFPGYTEDEIVVGGIVRPKRPKTRANPTPEQLGFHDLPPARVLDHEN